MHSHASESSGRTDPELPTIEPADPMACVGPDGVHACGGHGHDHGDGDGICRHADGTSHGCGDCPNCKRDEPAIAKS